MKALLLALTVIVSANGFAGDKVVEFDPEMEKKCFQLEEQGKKLPAACKEILKAQDQ